MKFKLRYNYQKICDDLLSSKLAELGLPYSLDSQGEVCILRSLTDTDKKKFVETLSKAGIEVVQDHNMMIVQQVKELLYNLVRSNQLIENLKVSEYIESKLPYSYNHITRIFSENTHTSIEKFLILKKIDYVKELLVEGKLSLSEIAYKLNYSDVSHLSKQFKNTTGLSPTYFLNLKNQLKTN